VGISASFGNTPPKISGMNCRFANGDYQTDILYGEKLCFTICTEDADEGDSVFLKAENLPFGSSFSVLNPGAQLQVARICFSPEKEPDVVDTFRIKVIAFSTKGANPIEVEQEFVVYVHQLSKFKLNIKSTGICGNILVEAKSTNDVEIEDWIITIGKFNATQIRQKNEFSKPYTGLSSGPQRISVSSFPKNGGSYFIDTIINIENGAPFWTSYYELNQCVAEQVKVDIDDFRRPSSTYQWLGFSTNERNKSFSRENDTTYKVLGTDGNCSDTLNIYHNVLHLEQKFTKSHKSASGATTVEFNLEGTSDADSFSFDFGDGTIENLGLDDFPISKYYSQPNKYEPLIECYKNGVDRCSQTFAFNPIDIYPTSVDEAELKLSIFPNPASEVIYLESNKPIEQIGIYNNVGQVLYCGNSSSISIDHLPKGTYLLKISFTDGQELIESIVLE
jgi:hypothetical protein